MDAENLPSDSEKNAAEAERSPEMDTGDPATLRDVGAKLEREHSEFEDPGFRSFWLMPVGLGIFLLVAALVIGVT